jgi:hypothetical protein
LKVFVIFNNSDNTITKIYVGLRWAHLTHRSNNKTLDDIQGVGRLGH